MSGAFWYLISIISNLLMEWIVYHVNYSWSVFPITMLMVSILQVEYRRHCSLAIADLLIPWLRARHLLSFRFAISLQTYVPESVGKWPSRVCAMSPMPPRAGSSRKYMTLIVHMYVYVHLSLKWINLCMYLSSMWLHASRAIVFECSRIKADSMQFCDYNVVVKLVDCLLQTE